MELRGQRMLDRNFVAGGLVKSQVKDMRNVLTAAQHAGLTLPFAELATRQYAAIEAGLGSADHSAALIALERANPGRRLGSAPDKLA